MKKLILFILLISILALTCQANVMVNSSNLGTPAKTNFSWTTFLELVGTVRTGNFAIDMANQIWKAPLSFFIAKEAIDNGEGNANDPSQKSNNEILHEYELNLILTISTIAWDLIKGLMLIIHETIKLFMIIFEMRLIIFIFIDFIPDRIIKLRDAIAMSMIRRSTK